MNADRMLTTVNKKAELKRDGAIGGVIIGIQRTVQDGVCGLRIYADIDLTMAMLGKELGLDVPAPATPPSAKDRDSESTTFAIYYDENGKKCNDARFLSLATDSHVQITCGPYKGSHGVVMGRTRLGDYRITFKHRMRNGALMPQGMVLGRWWPHSATAPDAPLDYFPIAQL